MTIIALVVGALVLGVLLGGYIVFKEETDTLPPS